MEVNLKKAHVFQTALNDAANSISVDNTVHINEFEDVQDVINKTARKLSKNIERRMLLHQDCYTLRGLIEEANGHVGINFRLTRIAGLNKVIAFLDQLLKSSTECPDITVLKKRIEKLNTQENRFREGLNTQVLDQETIDAYKKLLLSYKKEKLKLSDEVAELNMTTKIVLPDSIVNTLTSEDII